MKKKKSNLIISQKLKYRRPRKGLSNVLLNYFSFKQTVPQFSTFAVQAAKAGSMTRNQLEAVRVGFRRPIKKLPGSSVWVLLKPDRIVTKRAQETRMGRGKGSPFKQIVLIHKGQLLFEMKGPSLLKMRLIFEKVHKKIPVPTSLIVVKGKKVA